MPTHVSYAPLLTLNLYLRDTKLLDHSSGTTTAVYAEVIMDKQVDAVSRIDKLFGFNGRPKKAPDK